MGGFLPDLPDAARSAYAEEAASANRRRLRPVLAAMTVVHILHVAAFWVGADEGRTLAPDVVAWRQAVVGVHQVSAVVAGLLTVLAFRLPLRWMPAFAWVCGTAYLLHGAGIAAADQLHVPMVTPYMAYAIVIALLLVLEPLPAAGMFAIGLVAVLAALFGFQPDPELRRSMLLHGPSVTIASQALVVFLTAARRRDLTQRMEIAHQKEELQAWNAELEERVERAVADALARAAEVERLDKQLQQQVRDRSRELARALEKLAVEDSPSDGAVGRVLAERFELRRLLGRGGMGEVYEGLDRTTGEVVAVKLVRTGSRTPVSLLRRFLREAEAVARLHHPNIVRMLHVDIAEDGTFFQVQELVHGRSLAGIQSDTPVLPVPEVVRVLVHLARALAAAHEADIVHRDVKPANIMLLPEEPWLKLLDFGVAKQGEAFDDADGPTTDGSGATLTRAGAVVGTPGFMGPEQAAGAEVTTSTDVYAWGVVGVMVLVGKRPLPGRPLDLEALCPAADAQLVSALYDALSPDPAGRPTAAGLVARLMPLYSTQGLVGDEVTLVTE